MKKLTLLFTGVILLRLGMQAKVTMAADEVQFVKEAYQRLIVTTAGNNNTLASKTVEEIRQLFDFEAFCHLVFQDIEERMQPQEHQEVTALFQTLFFANIARKGIKISHERLADEKYELASRTPTGSVVILSAKAMANNRQAAVTLQFELNKKGNSWGIQDITVNSVELSRNYRGQFNKIYRLENVAGLITRMQKKLALLKTP